MLSIELAKELGKYLEWEPTVGDLTIVFNESGDKITEPIIPRHEKEKKMVLSLQKIGDLIWIPRLARLLSELKTRSPKGFVLGYDQENDEWYYNDGWFEIRAAGPEDAAARALLHFFKREK
jgi:hypothetical protein